jgi:hypothetical protein
VREFGIAFPVGQDNRFGTWRAWGNRAWPSFYLLDRDGRVVLVREGEGHAREIEGAIRGLLGLSRSGAVGQPGDDPDLSRIRTPEIYFGAMHGTPQDRAQSPRRGEASYRFGSSGAAPQHLPARRQLDAEEEALVLAPHGRVRCASPPQAAPRRERAGGRLAAGARGWRRAAHGPGGPPDALHPARRRDLWRAPAGVRDGLAGLSLFSATFG